MNPELWMNLLPCVVLNLTCSYCYDKTHWPKPAWRWQGLSQCIIKGNQSKSARQELKQTLWKNNTCRLVPHDLLFYTLREYPPRLVPFTLGWACLYQLFTKKMHRLVYRPFQWRNFLSWGSLFPHDSTLSQVDKKLTRKTFIVNLPRFRII